MVRGFITTRVTFNMSTDDIMVQVREFLGQFIKKIDIDADQNLFTSGLVNSLFAMQLVLFIEKEFGIQIANEDLDFENFKSLNAITSFIQNKLGSST